ncbi:hypothetical protein [Nonomuraea sp. SBT364]|uniref:hypothetical protein n=1 Tax=Nonomuraea sp. SBT364 TaxID=1580530 RepID=UPI00066C142B|nr:hypothetical protein [Nonomuraea sp. SBT364]
MSGQPRRAVRVQPADLGWARDLTTLLGPVRGSRIPAQVACMPEAVAVARRAVRRAARRAGAFPDPPVIADLTLGSRLSFAVLGWTLFLGVVAALLTATRDDPPLAARELPAYHQLTAADLRGDPGDLPGRYTLRKIPAYGRLHPALLGPSLSPRAPGGAAITLKGRVATVVSVPAGATQSLQRGDHATLIAKKEPAIDVLVLDVLSADRVVLAMLPADLSGLANMPAPIQIAKHLN